VRLPDRIGQDRPRLVASLPRREPDAVGDLDVGQAIAPLVAHLVGIDDDLERLRLSPARRDDVDVDGGAAADRDQQQLGRGELLIGSGAEHQPPAAIVDRDELAGRDALDGEFAVRGICHRPTLPESWPRPLRRRRPCVFGVPI